MKSLKKMQFEKDQIVMEVKGGSKQEVIEQLVAPLVKMGLLESSTEFIEEVLTREEVDTTIINGNLAIPMARTRNIKRLGITFGLNKDSKIINYGGTEIKVICLLAIPHNTPTIHLPILKELVEFATNEVCVQTVMKYKTPGRILQRLRNY